MHCFAFDIETVPDTELGRRLFDLDGLDDEDVAKAMFALRKQQTGDEFLALHCHRVVAISVAMRTGNQFRVWSLGELEADEAELIRRFYDGLERYTPDLVSWNGSGFDLPVLHYRALRHGIAAPRYWEMGDDDQAFRWNNYLNRFHWRHTDLMDVLSGFQGRARAPLDQIAVMLGFPGKLGMSGAHVWDAYRGGRLQAIRDYYYETGRMVGMKPAGGISTSKLAVHYLVMLRETLGNAWMTPEWFRFGASSLANDVLMQIVKQETGVYQSADYFSKD